MNTSRSLGARAPSASPHAATPDRVVVLEVLPNVRWHAAFRVYGTIVVMIAAFVWAERAAPYLAIGGSLVGALEYLRWRDLLQEVVVTTNALHYVRVFEPRKKVTHPMSEIESARVVYGLLNTDPRVEVKLFGNRRLRIKMDVRTRVGRRPLHRVVELASARPSESLVSAPMDAAGLSGIINEVVMRWRMAARPRPRQQPVGHHV